MERYSIREDGVINSYRIGELLDKYMYLIRAIAVEVSRRSILTLQLDDLISEGVIGFLDGVKRYDINNPSNFKTYIRFRIRGAIIDYLRQNYKEYAHRKDRFYRDVIFDSPRLEQTAQVFELFGLFNTLSPRQKEVLVLLYEKDLLLEEIGKLLNLTPSRISQIHKEAIRILRSRI